MWGGEGAGGELVCESEEETLRTTLELLFPFAAKRAAEGVPRGSSQLILRID